MSQAPMKTREPILPSMLRTRAASSLLGKRQKLSCRFLRPSQILCLLKVQYRLTNSLPMITWSPKFRLSIVYSDNS